MLTCGFRRLAHARIVSARFAQSAHLLRERAFHAGRAGPHHSRFARAHLRSAKRENPIRLTPTFEQFNAIIADVRAQAFNADAQDSADFLEFFGLLDSAKPKLVR